MANASVVREGRHLDDGASEFEFTDADFQDIAAMLRFETGISRPESKAQLVYSRLTKRLRHLHLASFREYRALLRDEDEERKRMFVALTTNVTRFVREPHHFEHLRHFALPPLVAAAKRGGRVRLWSSACSSGEEPFSMALAILGLCPEAASLDIRILATDFSTDMLAKARRGVYSESDLDVVPNDMRRRWFHPAGESEAGAWQVGEEMRGLVRFRELNLMGRWPMRHQFDIVFCRNVVIYFDPDVQATLWGRLVESTCPSGWIYVGHSERITGAAASHVQGEGMTIYSRVESSR